MELNWYVSAGGKPIGPLPEEQVVDMIGAGMRPVAICPAGASEWQSPATHGPFAEAFQKIERRRRTSSPAGGPPESPNLGEVSKTVRTRLAAATRVQIQSIAYVAAIVAATIYIIKAVTASLPGSPGDLERSAYANESAAFITLTNRGRSARWACFRGQVTQKSGSRRVTSAAVCTGKMDTMTTVSLQAPFPPGEIRDACSKKEGPFGLQLVDWELCSFTLDDVTFYTN